jgi:hypothetical protein
MSKTTTIRIAFAAIAILFFTAPIAARTLGITAEAFENRRFADAPKLSQGWDAFQQTTRYLTDRMPLRAQAVRANTRIWRDMFGADPRYETAPTSPDAALPFTNVPGTSRDDSPGDGLQGPVTAKTGRAGWLFLDAEFEYACDKSISNAAILERWGDLVRATRASGRDSALFAVPEKASVYPEYLPKKYPFQSCALEAKERFWTRLAEDGPALGIHQVRNDLLRLKPKAGAGLFQRKDLHWTTLGALTLVDAVLETFGDDIQLEQAEIVARGNVTYDGDLAAANGDPISDTRMEYDIVRRKGATRIPGRTLLICDSFAYKWMRLFKPYFEDLRYESLYSDENAILAAIRQADRVIFEAEEVNLKAHADKEDRVLAIVRGLRQEKR